MRGLAAALPRDLSTFRYEGSVKVAANWVATGALRWDLEANKLNQYVVGAGYVDDCFVLHFIAPCPTVV